MLNEVFRHHNPEHKPIWNTSRVRRPALALFLAVGLVEGAFMVQPTSVLSEGPRFAPSPQSTPLPDVIDTDPSQHPSGKDRNIESGNSYPQGKSGSNPDGGGVDKPYPAGDKPPQTQGKADFDGNNGCGNDNDFSDDNKGNCGGKDKNLPPETVTPVPSRTVTPDISPTVSPNPDRTSVAIPAPGSTQEKTGPVPSITALRTPAPVPTSGVEVVPKTLPKSGEENNLPLLATLGAGLMVVGLEIRKTHFSK